MWQRWTWPPVRRASRMSRMAMISSASDGNALEPEPRAHEPFVHRAAVGERRLLAVVGHRDAEGARVLERGAHQVRAHHRLAVVAHRHRAGAHHLAELGERARPSGPPRSRRSGRRAPRRRRCACANDEPDRRLVVGDRIGVRHGADGGESAGGRRARAGGDRLHVLAARLAQVAVHVDESRATRPVRRSRRSRADAGAPIGHPRPNARRCVPSAISTSPTASSRCDGSTTRPPRSRYQFTSSRRPRRLAASASSGRPPDSR